MSNLLQAKSMKIKKGVFVFKVPGAAFCEFFSNIYHKTLDYSIVVYAKWKNI